MAGILSDVGNFLNNNASTVGSILGGIGGELIDPFGGGIAGAALGSGLGKAYQNEKAGNGLDLGSDVTAGLEGGAGQALGYGAAAGLGKVAGAVGRAVAPKIADTGIGDILGKVTTGSLRKLGNTVGINPTLDKAASMGIIDSADPTKLTTNDIEKMSSSGLPNVATGADGIISATRDAIADKALDESGRTIDLDQVRNMADDTAQKYGLASDLTTGGQGGLPRSQGAGASGVDYAMGVLRRAPSTSEGARNLLNEADSLPSTNPLKGFYNEVANNVRSQIYDSPEVKNAIANYKTTPEDQAEFLKATGGNQKFAQYISDTLDNATKNSDLAQAHSDLINVRALGDAAKSVSANTIQKAAPDSGGIPLEAAGHVMSGNPLGAVKTVAKNALTSPEGASKVSKVAQAGGDILNRMAKFTGPATAGTFAAGANAMQPGMQNTANVTPTGGNMNQQPTGATSPIGTDYNSLLQAMSALAILDPTQAGNASSVLGSILPTMTKAATANPLVTQAQGAALQPGVSGNPIDLILAKIPGTPQWQAAQAAQRAAAALGTTSTYSPLAAPGANASSLSALGQIPANLGV